MQASVPVAARRATLREDLVDAQQRLVRALDRVGADDWLRRSPTNEGWTVHELLTHLTTAENGFVPTLKRMANGQGGVPDDFDPNRWNAGQLRRRGETPPEQLRLDLAAAHAAMLAVLDTLDNAQLDQHGRLSSGVDGSTEDCFSLVAAHKRGHTGDIEAALA